MSAPLYDATTLWELVERRAAASPDEQMLVDERDRRVTYAEFKAWAERVAAGLHARGVTEGTVVTWQLPTRIETVVVSMALCRLGAVQNPILHIYREREVGFTLRQMRPSWYLVAGTWRGFDYAAMARSLVGDLDHPVEVLVLDEGLPEGDPATLPPPPATPDGEAPIRWVYSTSGTTSEPKGVRHTDQTLIAGGIGLAVALDMSPTDVGTVAFPFAHIAGPDYLVMMLTQGFSALLFEAFVIGDAVEVLRRHGATMAGGGPAFYTMFLNEQRKDPSTPLVPSLRLLSGGGAPKPPEVFFEVQREMHIPVAHGYGMTECPMITQGSPHDTDEQLAYTDGKPVRGCEIKITLADETVAAPGVDGEVRVRGPMVCKGYTDPALTAEAFDAEGYFRTGDVGHLRADGHLVLTGRSKELIIRKGENISPKEIEDLLYQHAKVGSVAVIGLPDRDRGELVCAVVETAPGQSPLAFEEMQEHCRAAGLMTQKIPERLEVVDEMPRNNTLNKILKYKLKERFAEAGA